MKPERSSATLVNKVEKTLVKQLSNYPHHSSRKMVNRLPFIFMIIGLASGMVGSYYIYHYTNLFRGSSYLNAFCSKIPYFVKYGACAGAMGILTGMPILSSLLGILIGKGLEIALNNARDSDKV